MNLLHRVIFTVGMVVASPFLAVWSLIFGLYCAGCAFTGYWNHALYLMERDR